MSDFRIRKVICMTMFGDRETSRQERSAFIRRISLLTFLGLVIFGLLASRIVFLTVWRGADLFYLSERNFLRQVKIPPPRGPILDRHGRVLAVSEPRYDLRLGPFRSLSKEQLENTREIVSDFHPDAAKAFPANVFNRQVISLAQHQTLAHRLPLGSVIPLLERQSDLTGLHIAPSFERVYPLGRSTCFLTGYTRLISPNILEQYLERGYDRDDRVGVAGIERTQETLLRGEKGIEVEHRDARGHLLSSRVQRRAVPGAQIVLTIDADLQLRAADLLSTRTGVIVAVDPRNGEVLALASHPDFDPNSPVVRPGSGDSQFNKVLQEHYAPGSTFKVVPAIAGLWAGNQPERRIFCGGRLRIASGFEPRCNVSWGHGSLNLTDALMVSCNVYFYQLSRELSHENLYSAARALGFGEPTGIDLLAGGESAGILPEPGSRASQLTANRVMMGIGQGQLVSVTPMQLVMAYSAIANGGTLYHPQVVRRVEFVDGMVQVVAPQARNRIDWTTSQYQAIRDGLRAAVEKPRGTAHKARFDPEMRAAGKTGTAQRLGHADAVFAGFAPWDDPEICVLVFLERAGAGGEMAAPLGREIFSLYFQLKNERTSEDSPASPTSDMELISAY